MTSQMQEDYSTKLAVEEIIYELKHLTTGGECVDGETMQHIIEEVGLQDQMLRQLMMTADRGLVESLWDEIVELEKSRDTLPQIDN